jgi:hypothetical protein
VSRREIARASRGLAAMATAMVAAGVLALVAGACGGGSERTDAEQIDEAMATLQEDLADGNVEGVCAALGPKPRYQLGTIGHDRRPTTCERDLRDYVAGIEQAALISQRPVPRLGAGPHPAVVRVEVSGNRATAVTTLEGDRLDIPFVREDGAWKLGDLFVVTGPVRRDLR